MIIDKHWKGKKVYEDVREITKEKLIADGIELPDVITGGFPCQPFSVAGKQKGTSDDRHLWPEMFRIIKALKPRIVVGENVRGIVNIQDGLVFETVCSDLEGEGFEIQPFIIPAAGVGAPHKRERVWIVGYSKHNGSLTSKIRRGNEEVNAGSQERQNQTIESQRTSRSSNDEIVENSRRTLRQGSKLSKKNANENRQEDANKFERSSSTSQHYVANSNSNGEKWNKSEDRQGSGIKQDGSDVADSKRIHVQGQQNRSGQEQSRRESWWEFEPNVGRVANGVPGRVHRLKGLGNSIVPQIAEEIGKAIMKVSNE